MFIVVCLRFSRSGVYFPNAYLVGNTVGNCMASNKIAYLVTFGLLIVKKFRFSKCHTHKHILSTANLFIIIFKWNNGYAWLQMFMCSSVCCLLRVSTCPLLTPDGQICWSLEHV